ncbi:MAG: hypothetical protein Q4F57_07040 [Weeksellaceae bacterium]|nr:hypothetical protein [Weeksellaceae bacterium]
MKENSSYATKSTQELQYLLRACNILLYTLLGTLLLLSILFFSFLFDDHTTWVLLGIPATLLPVVFLIHTQCQMIRKELANREKHTTK